MNPTQQQEACLTLTKIAQMVKVVAPAGAGKTSTLVYTAENVPLKSIYLAFNKVTAEEAEARFPAHVTCKTTHSVAFRFYGAPLMSKLNRPKGRYVNVAGTGSEIARYYNLDGVGVVATSNAVGLFVKSTVERFEQSADLDMTMAHLPKKDMEKALAEDPSCAAYVLKFAKRLWADRINISSPVLATHDTYLKQFQMSKPVLPYDVVYVDEFQDTTPCVLDIVMNQKEHAKLVMIGDPRQAIYGWRGAVNAMQMVDCPQTELSQSFRYGQGIADVATAVLHHDMIVTGRQDIKTKVGFDVVDRSKEHMYLFRTNAMLLMEAVAAVDRGEKVKIEIDTKDFVKILQSAQALFKRETKNVKHERILPYSSWWNMVQEAEEVGGELKRLVNIVEGRMAEHIIEVLEHYVAPYDAVAIYTTAHKAKGRECNQVVLASDFPTNFKDGEWKGLQEAEENLLYVAVTRAKRVLEINQTVLEVLEKYKMEYIGESPYEQAMQPVLKDTSEQSYQAAVKAHIRKEQREVERIIHGD